MAPKIYLHFLPKTTIETLSTNSGTKPKAGKLANRWVSLLAPWIASTYFKQAEAFQDRLVKLNESRRLKIYQVEQLKENSTENSAEKDFKENSQFNELWNISTKQKRKENY